METATVLIIGAGLGGIATAARLASHGYQVTVLEKGEQAGGRCNRLVKAGHHFDTGPTLLLMPHLFAETFADLGERLEDHLELLRVDPTYHVHFSDGSTLQLTADMAAMETQLEAIEPGSFAHFLRYLDEGKRHYDLAFPNLVTRDFHSFFEMFSLSNLWLMGQVKLLKKHYGHMRNYFQYPRLKATFTFQDMYLSLSPYQAPATYSLLPYSEFADGVWFPKGGMYSLIEALVNIAQKRSVQFMYNTPVEKIDVVNRQVTGVTLADSQQIQADIVVANADLPYVYRALLPNDRMARRLARKKYTCSTIMFYWGVDKQYPQLGPHNLFLAEDYCRGFKQVFNDLGLPDEPTFYLHTPVKIDPAMAPVGQDTLVVVVPVGHINDAAPQDWAIIQQQARQRVLHRLAQIGLPDLAQHIKVEESYTPRDWLSRYNLTKGATLGLGHNLRQMGYLRPQNRHARYRNLYFVGASTHPGGGLPTVLLSARFTTERILRDVGMPIARPILTLPSHTSIKRGAL